MPAAIPERNADMNIHRSHYKTQGSPRRPLRRIRSLALSVVLAFVAMSALADDVADYPAHVKDEIRAAELEREARLIKLHNELQTLRDVVLDAKIRRYENVRTLLQADQEIRALLKQHPELYPLYQSALGQDAGPLPEIPGVYGTGADPCKCLHSAEALWLGGDEQSGQAVLTLGNSIYDVRVGSALGNSPCVLNEADGSRALLECRHPRQAKVKKRSITMKRFHRVQGSEPVPDNTR